MFVCALDVGRAWIRLVLTVDYPQFGPEFLGGQRFPRCVEASQIVEQLDTWVAVFGGHRPEAIVCCSSDPIPEPMLAALDEQAPVEWVDSLELRMAQAAWRSMRLDPQWLRGGLLGLLFSSPMAYATARNIPMRTALDWTYAQRRRQLLNIETELFAEGRILCPGHLSPRCPHCEAWEEQESQSEDVPF